MDAMAGLLDGPRARDAFLLRSSMDPPWSLRVQDEAPLTIVAMVRGSAWVVFAPGSARPGASDPGVAPSKAASDPGVAPSGAASDPGVAPSGAATATGVAPSGPRLRLAAGDVVILLGPDPYVVADDPATAPQAVIHPGQRCTTPDGVELEAMRALGVRSWGNAADGRDVLLTGTYALEGEVSRRLLRALPPALVLRDGEWDCPVIPLLADEVVKDAPGQEAVLDRLLDVLLIAVLRAWFARPEAEPPGWYAASGDPIVGPALRLLHHEPARRWTVGALADEAGVSRAALARRFNALVGEPPMSFLTGWRIALAADLLLEPGATVGSVAHEVGYGSAFALSTAFKRVRGMSPTAWRARATGEPEAGIAGGLPATAG
jgi:AraC-like DNA-binding protein